MKTTNSRKVLIPLATLLAAGAIAVGSGATFTSSSVSSAAVTSGTLSHTNNHNGATMNVTNIKPGDTVTGTVTITNNGNLDSTLALTESSETNTFEDNVLGLTITQSGNATPLYNGEFGDTAAAATSALGNLAVGDSTTLTFVVTLASSAGNANQGKAAAATFNWVTTQKAGTSTVASWLP